MLFLLARILAFFGVDMQTAQKIAIWILIGFVALAVLIAGLWLRSCFSKSAKLDEQEIQAGQAAIQERNDERLKDILVKADVKDKIVAGEVANAAANTEAAKTEAKKKYDAMTAQELQEEFNRQAGIQ